MPDITSLLMEQLTDPEVLDAASKQFGFDSSKLTSATSSLLPMLIAGLTRNTQQPNGADSLFNAIKRDHDGSILDDLTGMISKQITGNGSQGGILQMIIKFFMSIFGGSQRQAGGSREFSRRTLNGEGILEHILGDKRQLIEKAISKISDLNLDQVSELAKKLAPLLMGSLGKLQGEQGLDAQGLSRLLQKEVAELEQKASPKNASGLIGMLDLDGDGDITDDLMNLSKSLLNN